MTPRIDVAEIILGVTVMRDAVLGAQRALGPDAGVAAVTEEFAHLWPDQVLGARIPDLALT